MKAEEVMRKHFNKVIRKARMVISGAAKGFVKRFAKYGFEFANVTFYYKGQKFEANFYRRKKQKNWQFDYLTTKNG